MVVSWTSRVNYNRAIPVGSGSTVNGHPTRMYLGKFVAGHPKISKQGIQIPLNFSLNFFWGISIIYWATSILEPFSLHFLSNIPRQETLSPSFRSVSSMPGGGKGVSGSCVAHMELPAAVQAN